MKERSRIVFHRGYNILADKYGLFTMLPKNVITVTGLRKAAKELGYGYMYNSHPTFNSLEECIAYIDKNYPAETK